MAEDDLAGTTYVTLIARLLVDRRGNVVRGELAETESDRVQPFVGWEGFTNSVVRCLSDVAETGSNES